MNQSHYDKSFSYSEILGKFLTISLDKYDIEMTEQLLSSRLKAINLNIEEVFPVEAIEIIQSFSKGIPRNIISAANLLLGKVNSFPIPEGEVRRILSHSYIGRIIKERIANEELRKKYMQIVEVLKVDYGGTAQSQEEFLKKLSERNIYSRIAALKHINKLVDMGIIRSERGGYNRIQRVLTLV